MAASSSWEFEALAQELIHGVAFSVPLGSGVQRAGRSDDMVRPARSSAERPAVDNSCVGLTALDIELLRLVSEVLVESIDCTVGGAQLDRAVNVQLRRGYFNAARIIIATHCRGRRRHLSYGESRRNSRSSVPRARACRAVETCRPALKWPTTPRGGHCSFRWAVGRASP
jgi:hypothetical protein